MWDQCIGWNVLEEWVVKGKNNSGNTGYKQVTGVPLFGVQYLFGCGELSYSFWWSQIGQPLKNSGAPDGRFANSQDFMQFSFGCWWLDLGPVTAVTSSARSFVLLLVLDAVKLIIRFFVSTVIITRIGSFAQTCCCMQHVLLDDQNEASVKQVKFLRYSVKA